LRLSIADADVDWVESVNCDVEGRRIIIGHPRGIGFAFHRAGRLTQIDAD